MSSVSSGVRERKGIPLFISCHSSWCHRLPAVPCPPPWFAAPKESKKYNSRAGACTGYIEGAGCRKEGGTMYLYHRNFVFNQWCGSRSLQIRTMGDPDLGTGTPNSPGKLSSNYLKPSIFRGKKFDWRQIHAPHVFLISIIFIENSLFLFSFRPRHQVLDLDSLLNIKLDPDCYWVYKMDIDLHEANASLFHHIKISGTLNSNLYRIRIQPLTGSGSVFRILRITLTKGSFRHQIKALFFNPSF